MTLDGPELAGKVENIGDTAWYALSVSTKKVVRVECWGGTLLGKDVRILDASNPPKMLARGEALAADQKAQALALLTPGSYSVTVASSLPNTKGFFSLKASSAGDSFPEVKWLALNNGAAATNNRTVTLNNEAINGAVEYLASENPNFEWSYWWQPYATAPTLQLSGIGGEHRVYFKVRDAYGVESAVASDTITVNRKKRTLLVNKDWVLGTDPNFTDDADWFEFKVAIAGAYDINTRRGVNLVGLYGPNTTSTLIGEGAYSGGYWIGNAFDGAAVRLVRRLTPGTYAIKVGAAAGQRKRDYDIRVTRRNEPAITNMRIDSEGGIVHQRDIKLHNQAIGSARYYMASESPRFKDAKWKPYSTDPVFILSPSNTKKTVYFKVKDARGRESAVERMTVQLNEGERMTVNSDLRTKVGKSKDFTFTIRKEDNFEIGASAASAAWFSWFQSFSVSLYGPDNPNLLVFRKDYNTSMLDYRRLKCGTYLLRFYSYMEDDAEYDEPDQAATLRIASYRGRAFIPEFELSNLREGTSADGQTTRSVRLNARAIGRPTLFKASESTRFTGVVWQAWPPDQPFQLSRGGGNKTVYLKFRDIFGRESKVASAGIRVYAPTPLPLNGEAVTGYTDGSPCYYAFTIGTAGQYTLDVEREGFFDLIDVEITDLTTGQQDLMIESGRQYGEAEKPNYETFNLFLTPGKYRLRLAGTFEWIYSDDSSDQEYTQHEGNFVVRMYSGPPQR